MAEVETLVYGMRITSAVPSRVTGEGVAHELTGMDLAVKLHHLKGLYYFSSGLHVSDMREAIFLWLTQYHNVCGRIRVPETGYPFIKLNDAGVRFIEARASKTVDEWLALKDCSLEDQLVPSLALHDGLDQSFIPLVSLQITWFRCGGMSVGLNWSHVLGDAFSCSVFMNALGEFLQGQVPSKPLEKPKRPEPRCSRSISRKPFSLKRVDPVGDRWLTAADCKMAAHSFHLTAEQLNHIGSSIVSSPNGKVCSIEPFELISAIIWKYIAKIRVKSEEPKIVTVCSERTDSKGFPRREKNSIDRQRLIPFNGLKVGTVEVDFPVSEADITKLASSLVQEVEEENDMIEELVEGEITQMGKMSHFIFYGANLTFFDMEEANVYGFKIKGERPIFANYTIGGVGEKGAILVLPAPDISTEGGKYARLVTAILPETELEELKHVFRQEWTVG
ncbi:hypothetical protein Nepgr_024172 [Nepenthes gracilis]|uniref:Uncharacterized protein n=1 Tax=Nepenthes gracilis TaxID=150966 RepID=A0AAD3T430_NEPGR|nr:hypothetical protein Nepgr_024172 [Nepenthes gracilis]